MIKIRGLVKRFPVKSGFFGRTSVYLNAVDGVDLDIYKGQTLGLAGESGCGKSTLGKSILRLIEPDDGEVIFNGVNLLKLPKEKMRDYRKKMQIVFQDPYSSLNPRMTVGDIIGEPLLVNKIGSRNERRDRVNQLLDLCGLKAHHINNYPHEFSGGQRQRICIARALALNPEFIVADEPVSALDVSIQGEIINLLYDLQEKFNIAYLFVAHDLKVVVQMSHEINIMYLGKIVEKFMGDKLSSAKHPYTQALVSAVPVADVNIKCDRIILKGDVPSPVNPPSGCRFHPRCPYMEPRCAGDEPVLREIEQGHFAACHFAEKVTSCLLRRE